MADSGLITPFDFELKSLDFTTSSGQVIDLRFIFTELNLFQDLFANAMNGMLVVTDSTNIFGHIGPNDENFLYILLDKPGLNKPFEHTFHIYNSTVVQITPNNQTVKLNFCSEELLISKAMRTTKVYNSMLIVDMVKDIAKNILKVETFPDTNIESTTNIHSLTVPGLTPFQAINWLSSKATSSYVGASFLFYENPTGFNFKSLQKLMDVSQPVATYNYNIKNIGGDDPNLDFFDVSKYQVIKTPDTLDSLITGKFASRLITLDVLRQKYTISDLNADDLFKSSVSVASGKAYTTNFTDRVGNQAADSYGGLTKFYPTNVDQNQASYIKGKQQINQTNVESWLLERNAQIMQIMGNRVKLVIPGNTMLKVGDVIKFNMPSTEPQTGSNEGEMIRKLDPTNTGMYLISAIRHQVTVRMFESVIELCRDTVYQG